MGMSVSRAQNEISSHEFAEWLAYERISPSDPERQDLRFAIVCCLLANAWRKSGQKPYEPKDFMLKFEEMATKTQEEVTMTAKHRIMLWANIHNARIAKNGQSR